MSLTPKLWARVEVLLAAGTNDFVALVEIAELDKTKAFRHGDLRKCQLQGQTLDGFDFSGAKFEGANVARAIFRGATLKGADLSKVVNFDDADFEGAVTDEHTIWPDDRWPCPEWADAAGRDSFGLWASFSVGAKGAPAVTQRMRRIPAGEFLMGSPDDEAGRYDDEGPRQRIAFAEGFWMFDTPCTQALWAAVMRGSRPSGLTAAISRQGYTVFAGMRRFFQTLNPMRKRVNVLHRQIVGWDGMYPSRFGSLNRPVETVSWKDARTFIERLNQQKPGLNLTLPSEAQWEYACRAGSPEATYAGPMEILGRNNAPVLEEIAWYGGNSAEGFELDNGHDNESFPEKSHEDGKAGTHPVGRKRPNQWGLHDMLGNVWEWCADEWHDTHVGAASDGAARDGGDNAALRVIRGGAWGETARGVRAACRGGGVPSRRGDYLGFRCARGPLA
ncbi:MAG: hypothetical protein EXR07_10330 [Acetobacteraceae bacterium]|nr:hypothetical protein [Acetobacteraceae bacterium]